MKISKLLNEHKNIGTLAYGIFKKYHYLKNIFLKNSSFELLGEIPPKLYVPYHPIPESNLYGHVEVFKKYINNKSDLKNFHIQHGVILGNLVQDIMINSFARTIITFSENRKKIIQKNTDKKIVAVGPYIRYAPNRLPLQKFKNLKNQFGKTLLVFPAHSSVDRTKINFDQISLINKIHEIKNNYDIKTVFVNLFYSDCKKETADLYEKEGFVVCSAGFWLSEYFLPNLRTIIELSDYTMSNRVGTHVGYCLALNKPHYIFNQQHKEEFIGKKGMEDLKQFFNSHDSMNIDEKEIFEKFSKEEFSITEEQLEVVRKYWGHDLFFSSDELKSLIL